jgi:hypothetical protein
MLVARALTRDNEALLILGLSQENRRRLVMGAPIDLQIGELHGPLKIVIFAGETEDSMQAELFALIRDRTTRSDGDTTTAEVP